MEADWEFEVGGGAPGIEADWPGFVDLRREPQRIAEIAEAAAFPPLAAVLQRLNADASPLWTAKCDLWEPQAEDHAETGAEQNAEARKETSAALACYIDLLPLAGTVFEQPWQAEVFCREWIGRLASAPPDHTRAGHLDLVIRQAFAGPAEGFGVTAYLSAEASDPAAAAAALADVLVAFADAIPATAAPENPASKLQWSKAGE